VLDNIVQDNIAGLSLANNSADHQTVVEHNLFRNNNQPGPGSGSAIYSDQYNAGGALTNVVIQGNSFLNNVGSDGYSGTAINLSSTATGSQSDIEITGNTFDGNGRALIAFNLADSSFTQNVVTNSQYVGSADLRLFEGVNQFTVTNNILTGNGTDLRGMRISDIGTGAPAASNITFEQNSITGYGNASVEIGPGAYTGTLDATGNWWGASTAAGVAAKVIGDVDFSPFLLTGTDTSPAPGFQGDASVAPGAGNVWVKVVDHRLVIIGDNLNNLISVEKGPTANSYLVTGLSGTQINKRSGSFLFEHVTKGISANLKGGDDMLVLDGSASPFTVPGKIWVRTGAGDDLVRLQGVTGKADIGSSSGKDVVQLIDSAFSSLAVDMGNGASTSLSLENVSLTGPSSLLGGNGADTVRLDRVNATGRLQVETGGGDDLLAVSGSSFAAAVVLVGGSGHDQVDAGTHGSPNTNGNTFGVNPVIRGFDDFLS
jgi:hypothetical protein